MIEQHPTGRSAQLVLVTGSTRGIGAGIATHLVESGSHVVLHGRDRGRVEEAEARAAGPGSTGRVVGGVAADLSVPGQMMSMADEVPRRPAAPEPRRPSLEIFPTAEGTRDHGHPSSALIRVPGVRQPCRGTDTVIRDSPRTA